MPWRDASGTWRRDCPLDVLDQWVLEASRWFAKWEKGIHPVSIGHARRLTSLFLEVMDVFTEAHAEERAKKQQTSSAG